MAKQSEIVAQLGESAKQIEKITNETRSLITKIETLQAAVDNQDNASPELVAASAAVATQLSVVDDLVPDIDPNEPAGFRPQSAPLQGQGKSASSLKK